MASISNISKTIESSFLTEDFLLMNEPAKRLYHEFAEHLPIIDYHCHLSPEEIAKNSRFENLTHIWLRGDHYKWRAMRALGVNEHFITGAASDKEKFMQWAEIVPYTVRNPLYHWTHMELKRPFGITDILSPKTAEKIYKTCNDQLNDRLSTGGILDYFKVEVVCSTDDPCDDLEFHQLHTKNKSGTLLLPAFRPDLSMNIENGQAFIAYLKKLEKISNQSISSYDDYLAALKTRHDYFALHGCKLSDHGLERMHVADYTSNEINSIFQKGLSQKELNEIEVEKFKSALLFQFALWDHEKGWTQQFHLGAIRNNNTRLVESIGKDVGVDSIGDFEQTRGMSKFFNKLDRENKLTKTIIYNVNPAHNAAFATMTGNFQDGSSKGKIQWGSAWWFVDQKDGMTDQLNVLSNMGVLSCFVGMITDSRSFLSFPRHEYFRRILCNLFGTDIVNGELPNDINWMGKIVQDISYYNAKNYFNF